MFGIIKALWNKAVNLFSKNKRYDYNIAGNYFTLKTVFTLGDWEAAIKVDEIFKKMSLVNSDTVKANLEKEDLIELLAIALIPHGKALQNIDIEKIPLTTVSQITNDFFLEYMRQKVNTLTSWRHSIENLTKLGKQSNV